MDAENASTSSQQKMMEEIEALKQKNADHRRDNEYLKKNQYDLSVAQDVQSAL